MHKYLKIITCSLPFCLILLLFQTAVSGFAPPGPVVQNKGVRIDYDDAGLRTAAVTLVFVHGWCINRSYWSQQVDYFQGKYRIITVDLPGFGASGRNRRNWSVEAYGSDLTALLIRLNLHNVILIGHSMSGAIVVEAALHNPGRVLGIIGVDNFKDIGQVESAESKQDEANFYAAARVNFKPLAFAYANEALFSKSTDSLVRNRVLTDIARTDSIIAIDCLEQANYYQVLPKLIKLKKRLYLINSDATPTDTKGFMRSGISYKIFTLHGTGHYPMIEAPDEFNILLTQALGMITHS